MSAIYHITHYENLPSILEHDGLWSDAERMKRDVQHTNVGIGDIKQRRLESPVHCHPLTFVGDYVPFYFCPRSLMLYLLHKGNRQGVTYQGGQRPVVHLTATMESVVKWAEENRVLWAFSDRNASIRYANFFGTMAERNKVSWDAVRSEDFRDPIVKEGKQAEFLLHRHMPWALVEQIGVADAGIAEKVREMLAGAAHCPLVVVKPTWYF